MDTLHNIRVIALTELETQEHLVALLAPLQVGVHLVEKLTDLPRVPAVEGMRDVILLPDECPDGEVWIINSILSQYTHQPAFLVYARDVSFARWSGVLDSGGIDVVTVPFEVESLRAALQFAAQKPSPS